MNWHDAGRHVCSFVCFLSTHTSLLSDIWRWIADKFLFILHTRILIVLVWSILHCYGWWWGLENLLFTMSVWGACLGVIPGMEAVEVRLPFSTASLFHLRNTLLYVYLREICFATSGTMISTFSLWSIPRGYRGCVWVCITMCPRKVTPPIF